MVRRASIVALDLFDKAFHVAQQRRELRRLARRLTGIWGRMFLSTTSFGTAGTISAFLMQSHCSLFRDPLFPLLAHVPNVDVIMGLIESRMTGIEVEGYVVALSGEAFKIELFPVLRSSMGSM